MFRALRLALPLLLSSFTPGHAAEPQADLVIRELVAAQAAAWTAGDGVAFGKDASADISFTNLQGRVAFGAAEFVKRHQRMVTTNFKGTTRRHVIRSLRFVTPDVAIVDIDTEISPITRLPPGVTVPRDGVLRAQLLEVFVRRDGRWWIEAYHAVDTKQPD